MTFLNNLKLGLKLPLMLVTIALVALTIMGASSYREARMLLEEEGNQRLERTLDSRQKALSQWAKALQSELRAMAANQGSTRMMRDLAGAWKMLGEDAQAYLHRAYVETNPNPPEERFKLDFAGDVNDYGIVHRRAHPGFVMLAQEKGLQDLYFIDPMGQVLYSMRKGGHFAADLRSAPFAADPLAQIVVKLLESKGDAPLVSEFGPVESGSGRVLYLAAPLRSAEGVTLGVLAFSATLDTLEAVMSEPRSLGDTGQAYLVDAQGRLQNPLRALAEPGLGDPLANPATAAALAGEAGRSSYAGLSGAPVKGVFKPLELFGKPLGLVVEQSEQELFGPARALAHKQIFNAGWLIAVLAAMSAWMARSVARPMRGLTGAIAAIAAGQHGNAVPGTGRGDEVGEIATALDGLRDDLARSQETQREATIQGTAFRNSSAALMMVGPDLVVSYVNAALVKLIGTRIEDFRRTTPDLHLEALVGRALRDIYPLGPEEEARLQDPARMPFHNDIALGDGRFGVDFSEIRLPDGARIGYVIEWRDVTELRMNRALLQALENTQLMLEFSPEGQVTRGNANVIKAIGLSVAQLLGCNHDAVIEGEGDLIGFWSRLERLEPVIGRFVLHGAEGRMVVAEGSVTPVPDRSGKILKIVLIANDITEAQAALDGATARNEAMLAAQQTVVDALRVGLNRLSGGDLRSQIVEGFPPEYEQLRTDFNAAVSTLSSAMQVVIDNAQTIDGEVREISNAAADLSQRTEKQAATLAETATALDQITSSVGAATAGISEADHVVAEARVSAENSGRVVQQAVAAMGEIEQSSQQISRIIGVIDDIAFQTNLLALNAGVEAARAGEAGRGFAVVASEVRALAQRSSEAAREIDALITTSSAHVRRGVDLVGETGSALRGILTSVNDISVRVSKIALSSREQSNGLAEINAAVIQLDQVTQQNAAMFEETTAASQALSRGAQVLTATTAQFRTTDAPPPPLPKKQSVSSPRSFAASATTAPKTVRVEGSLARAAAVDENDWEDF